MRSVFTSSLSFVVIGNFSYWNDGRDSNDPWQHPRLLSKSTFRLHSQVHDTLKTAADYEAYMRKAFPSLPQEAVQVSCSAGG